MKKIIILLTVSFLTLFISSCSTLSNIARANVYRLYGNSTSANVPYGLTIGKTWMDKNNDYAISYDEIVNQNTYYFSYGDGAFFIRLNNDQNIKILITEYYSGEILVNQTFGYHSPNVRYVPLKEYPIYSGNYKFILITENEGRFEKAFTIK